MRPEPYRRIQKRNVRKIYRRRNASNRNVLRPQAIRQTAAAAARRNVPAAATVSLQTVPREAGMTAVQPAAEERTAHRAAGTTAVRFPAKMRAGMTTARRAIGEEEAMRKITKRISRIIALLPIILKVIEVAVDSIRIARRNLRAN